MTDWKDALQALTGQQSTPGNEPAKAEKVDRKKRVGVVYSTNPYFDFDTDETAEPTTLPSQQQKLRLSIEKAGRAGKTVTLVRGFVGTSADLAQLCKLLKQRCGVGGAVKEGNMVIQGDHRQKLLEILKKEGYTQTK